MACFATLRETDGLKPDLVVPNAIGSASTYFVERGARKKAAKRLLDDLFDFMPCPTGLVIRDSGD